MVVKQRAVISRNIVNKEPHLKEIHIDPSATNLLRLTTSKSPNNEGMSEKVPKKTQR